MSSIRCVGFDVNTLTNPFVLGTIAMFDVITPSEAFNVDASGSGLPFGHIVTYPSGPRGTTVALKT